MSIAKTEKMKADREISLDLHSEIRSFPTSVQIPAQNLNYPLKAPPNVFEIYPFQIPGLQPFGIEVADKFSGG